MKRIATLVAIILTLVGCGAVVEAQQPKKVPRIGIYRGSTELVSPPFRGNSAGSARAWLHRRTEHRHRVPICGGEARSAP